MHHLLSLLFAVVFSFGHNAAEARHPRYLPESADSVVSTYGEVVAPQHNVAARRIVLNSYSEDACLSCSATNGASQPRLIWRAQR